METEMKSFDSVESVEPVYSEEEDYVEQEKFIFVPSEIEKEIEEERCYDFQTNIELVVELGKHELKPLKLSDCYFSERPGMHLEILPKIIFDTVDEDLGEEEIDIPKPIFRETIDQGTLFTTEFKHNTAQTLRSKLLNSWTQYEPRLYSDEEKYESLNNSSFNNFLCLAEERVFEALIHNNTADSFQTDLKSLYGDDCDFEQEKESCLTLKGSFSSSESSEKKIITSIEWHPSFKDIFFVSTLQNIKFEERIQNMYVVPNKSAKFYVWSAWDQFIPKALLQYNSDILVFKFNPTTSNLIAGGSLSGELILWHFQSENFSKEQALKDKNMKSNLKATSSVAIDNAAASSLDHSHMHGITGLKWIPDHFEVLPKGDVKLNGTGCSFQIVTSGFDGFLRFWDLRSGIQGKAGQKHFPKKYSHLDGTWEPFHSVEILSPQDGKCISLTSFDLSEGNKSATDADRQELSENISTEFYAGCEDGQVLCANFKLVRDETGAYVAEPPDFFMSPHSSSVTMIEKSPFIKDIFFSTGSRAFAIWKHNIKMIPIFFKTTHAYITAARWSHTRPAVFILGFEDGSIEIWDLLHNIYEPCIVHFISTSAVGALSSYSITDVEHVLAVGDSEGVVYMLALPLHLWKYLDNEPNLMKTWIEIEASRIQEVSLEESLTSKQAEIPKKGETTQKQPEITVEEMSEEERLLNKYKSFSDLQKLHLKYLGLTNEEKVEKYVNEETKDAEESINE